MATSYSGSRPKPAAPQGQVAHEQGVVDDQQVGRPHPPAGLEVEAVLVPAGTSGPGSCRSRSGTASQTLGSGRKSRSDRLPSVGPVGPEPDLGELVELLGPLEQSHPGAGHGHVQPAEADVVGPALDQDGRELLRHHRPQERDVLAGAAAPGGDRVRRDDDLLASARRRPGSPGRGRRSSCRRPCRPRPSGGPGRSMARATASAISSCSGAILVARAAAARRRRRVRGSRAGRNCGILPSRLGTSLGSSADEVESVQSMSTRTATGNRRRDHGLSMPQPASRAISAISLSGAVSHQDQVATAGMQDVMQRIRRLADVIYPTRRDHGGEIRRQDPGGHPDPSARPMIAAQRSRPCIDARNSDRRWSAVGAVAGMAVEPD